MKLQFKFANKTGNSARQRVLDAISEFGVSAPPHPLLPDETDAELAALYVVDVDTQKQADKLVALLEHSSAIEFVEPEVRRKLIR